MRYGIILAVVLMIVTGRGEAAVKHATGSFEVTVVPQNDPAIAALKGMRMAVTKTYTGGLAATANAVMLSAGDPATGSAGYAALERVDGTIDGRAGGFALIPGATMDRGAPDMRIAVVPGSGTGALTGITGAMTMRIDGGKHFYDLSYDIAP